MEMKGEIPKVGTRYMTLSCFIYVLFVLKKQERSIKKTVFVSTCDKRERLVFMHISFLLKDGIC